MPPKPISGLLALNRFGFGARGDGDLAAAQSDPRGFVLAELKQPGIALLGGPDLPSTPAALKTLYADQEAKRLEREAEKAAAVGAAMAMNVAPPAAQPQKTAGMADQSMQAAENKTLPQDKLAADKARPKPPSPEQQTFRADALARMRRAAVARAGIVERLVAFWSNHFCVSALKGGLVRIAAGAYEREAIRPHVLGRFSDMLLAAESHPAMIFYLDNEQSAGANSIAGKRPGRGLNENLAREIMELHTLGVDGGYTQADVTTLAKIISGWTFAGREGRIGDPGSPVFFANFHEPGPQNFLGRAYPQENREQGEAALRDLARAPATAQHIATKLARHFVADDPPPALVARLAKTFRDTDGDLGRVTEALVTADESWSAPAAKLRDPWQFVIAAMRLTGREPTDPGAALGALNVLGQPLWSPPGPNGFPDTVAAWASPEGMKARLEISNQIASRIPDPPNPVDLLQAMAGDAASPETRQAVARAETKQQGLALLLMSPEMQRR